MMRSIGLFGFFSMLASFSHGLQGRERNAKVPLAKQARYLG
jgi:hypothetical protein